MANTVINTPELLNLDSTTGATILAKGTISERPSIPTFNADYLIIAGGGGGGGGRGGNATVWSAGGGGGGYQYSTGIKLLIDTNYTITVGAGGAGGAGNGTPISSDGENSSIVASGIINEVATGGIGGGKSQGGAGGASGSLPSNSGGTSYSAGNNWGAGGGAGIGSNGSNGSSSSGGAGGNGLQFSITGTATYYSGGGGGGIYQVNNGGSGGLGGGGNGKGTTANGDNGLINTGGGGGGAGSKGASAGVNFTGGTGGSGIVILRYPNSYTINIGAGLTSSTITDGSEKVTSFTAGTGTITFSGATSSNSDEYPIDGTLRFNTETNKTEYYDGTGWYEIVDEYASGFIGPATNYFDTKLYTGNGATQSIGGYINGTGSFNGSSSYISGVPALTNSNAEFTISMWFKCNTTASRQYLFGEIRENGTYDPLFLIWLNTSGYLNTEFRNNSSSTSGVTITDSTNYCDNSWHHIVSILTTSQMKMYIDGSEVSSSPANISGVCDVNNVSIGARNNRGTNGDWFNGSIDQVRIYNTALSSSDVTALYGETAATATTAAFPSGQTAVATYTMDTSANGLLNTQDLSTVNYPAGAGCIALYEMNGNSNDTSGTYNGTPVSLSYQGGAFDQAAVFNGSNSKITLSSTISGIKTYSFWINPNSSGNATYARRLFGDVGGTSYTNSITFDKPNSKVTYFEGTSARSSDTISNNTWSHIAFTSDGSTLKVYTNGSLSNTYTTSGFVSSINEICSTASNRQFNGLIDQVRIFDTALSASDITTLARGVATSYSGTATNVNFNGHLDFAPDFVWVKNRTVAVNHYLYDSIRGTGPAKALHSNTPASEASASTYSVNGGIQSIDTNGFTAFAGTDTTYQGTNKSGNDYVSWNWKAGGAAVTNNNGTIASQVSANKDSGFSIVKYTGNNTDGATVGTGLTEACNIVIVKDLTSANYWCVGGSTVGNGENLYLNDPGQKQTRDRVKSVQTNTFTLGSHFEVNSSNNFIAYCFHSVAGYSKMGSYTGNGSTTGTIVTLDFAPSFVMIKGTDQTSDWIMIDNKRDTTNPNSARLDANSSGIEYTGENIMDLNSDGFQLKTSSSSKNGLNKIFIYMAFA